MSTDTGQTDTTLRYHLLGVLCWLCGHPVGYTRICVSPTVHTRSRGKKELEHTCVGGKITVDTPSRARCKMLSMRRSMMTTLAMRSRPTRRQSSLPVGRTRRARLLLIWRVNECEWIGADVGCLSWQRGGCVFGVTAARGDVCTRCMLHPRRLHQAPFEAQARRCFYGRHDAVLLRSGRSCT